MPVTIEVCERLMDHTAAGESKYHAQIEGEPGVWSAGLSPDDAIGNLVRCHPGRFGVAVKQLGRLAR